MTEFQKENLARLIAVLRSGDYPKNPDVHGGRTLDGKYWHFGSIACEVYRLSRPDAGYWTIEKSPYLGSEYFHFVVSGWDMFSGPNPVWEFFGLWTCGFMLVKEWLEDPSGHATPLRANSWELEQEPDFGELADALERTYLLPIPTSGFKHKASTKGSKDYVAANGPTPFADSLVKFS